MPPPSLNARRASLLSRSLVFLLALALCSAPARTAANRSASGPLTRQRDAACDNLYTAWRANYDGDGEARKKAYDSGTAFLTRCPNHEYRSYVENWVAKYEEAARAANPYEQLRNAHARQDWRAVVHYGKQITAADPNDLDTHYFIVYATMWLASTTPTDESLQPDALKSARRAIQLVEAGKTDAFTAEQWKTIGQPNKSELLAYLNYSAGYLSLTPAPGEAAAYLVKAIQGSANMRTALTYQTLGYAYHIAEYNPLADDFNRVCAGRDRDLTDECELKSRKTDLAADRVIDAYARAVALAHLNPAAAAKRAEWMQTLELFYRYRHDDKTDGLNELIANIQSRPLLLPSMQTMETGASRGGDDGMPVRTDVYRSNDPVVAAPPAAPLQTGRYFALVIGNNLYENFSTLRTPQNDAKALARLLQDRFGFEPPTFLPDADERAIIRAINEFRVKVRDGDSLLIYYAGHGDYDEETQDAYWLGVNAEKNSKVGWIQTDVITSNVRAIKNAKHILVISDSCYSGKLLFRDVETPGPAAFSREEYVREMYAGHSRNLISSGGNQPVLDSGGGDHSVFSNALLEALRSMRSDQFTAWDLFIRVREEVRGKSRQTPDYGHMQNSGHTAGDFVFTRRN